MDDKKIFEFTYGVYSKDDPIVGITMILISFLPHIAAIVTITLMIAQRSRHHFCFLLGLILSHESAKLLKRLCAQPRPIGSFLTSYGMPSDHAQFTFFIAMYVFSQLKAHGHLVFRSMILSSITLVLLCIWVCYSRLYLGVHTLGQVLVGSVLGLVLGRLWFLVTHRWLVSSKRLTQFFNHSTDKINSIMCKRRK